MTISVRIKGIDALKSRLAPGDIAAALRKGLLAGAAVVETAAKRGVHSPDNPFVGKAGRDIATGKLQSSLGIGNIEGSGLGLSVRVGHPHGRAGLPGGTFSRSTDTGRRTRSGGIIPGRTGGRRNKGDVTVYGKIEEKRHPFLEPAVRDNVDDIVSAIEEPITRVLVR